MLDLVRRESPIPERLRERLAALRAEGIIESVGRGTGTRYLLSSRYYAMVGKSGEYTRRRGLDRETNKELLLKHITDNAEQGSAFRELWQVLPSLSREGVRSLLRELRSEGRIRKVGQTKASRWYPVVRR